MTPALHQRIRQYLVRGWSYRMIAGALGCKVETVRTVAGGRT